MTRALSPIIASRLAKAATANGFDQELERERDWLAFASMQCPLRMSLGAFGDAVFLAAFSQQNVARALGEYGIPMVTPNDLRRTYASWLVNAGAPLRWSRACSGTVAPGWSTWSTGAWRTRRRSFSPGAITTDGAVAVRPNLMAATGAGGARAEPPFPRQTLRGVSLDWLRRNKPRGWREVPTRNNEGWIWLDTAGRERLRFMRPNGENPSASQWSRQANGYFRWQDEAGNYLDIDGNVVPPSHPQFNERTHIMYEGP